MSWNRKKSTNTKAMKREQIIEIAIKYGHDLKHAKEIADAIITLEQKDIPTNVELEKKAKDFAISIRKESDEEKIEYIITDWLDGAYYVRAKYLFEQKESKGVFQIVKNGNKTDIYLNGKLIEPNSAYGIPLTMEQCDELMKIKEEYFNSLKEESKSAEEILKKHKLCPEDMSHYKIWDYVIEAMEEYRNQPKQTPTDEEIEKWLTDGVNWNKTFINGAVYGAKSMRDGKISEWMRDNHKAFKNE